MAGIVPVAIAAYVALDILSGGAGDPPLIGYLEVGNLALGLVLALQGGFRASAMSRAMGGMAVGQLLIGGAILSLGTETASTALTVSGILAVMFGGSAWAFAQVRARD